MRRVCLVGNNDYSTSGRLTSTTTEDSVCNDDQPSSQSPQIDSDSTDSYSQQSSTIDH